MRKKLTKYVTIAIRRIRAYRKESGTRIVYLYGSKSNHNVRLICGDSGGLISYTEVAKEDSSELNQWNENEVIKECEDKFVFILSPTCLFQSNISIPTKADSKEVLANWLQRNNIEVKADSLKIELWKVIQTVPVSQSEFRYTITQYLTHAVHKVLHIPTQSRDLDPYIMVEARLREKASTGSEKNLLDKLRDIDWKQHISNVDAIEASYFEIERNFEKLYEQYEMDEASLQPCQITNSSSTEILFE